MRFLPRSRRGTWLLAGAVWLALCAGWWWMLPVAPRAVVELTNARCFDFTPDGAHLVAFDWNGRSHDQLPLSMSGAFSFWDCATGKSVGRPIGAWKTMFALAPSPNRRWWYLGQKELGDRRLQVLDVVRQEAIALPIQIAEWAGDAAFSPDSRLLIVDCRIAEQPGIALWNLDERKLVGTVSDVQFPVAVSTDGKRLIATKRRNNDGDSMHVFDLPKLGPIGCMHSPENERIVRIAITADGSIAVTASMDSRWSGCCSIFEAGAEDKTLRCWDLATGQQTFSVERMRETFALSDCGQSMITLTPDEHRWQLNWRDPSSGDLQATCRLKSESRWLSLVQSVDSRCASLAVEETHTQSSILAEIFEKIGLDWPWPQVDCRIESYDMHEARHQFDLPGRQACWSPDGRTLAAFMKHGDPSRIGLWDIPPRKSLTWLAAGSAILALPIAFVARRRVRSLRAV